MRAWWGAAAADATAAGQGPAARPVFFSWMNAATAAVVKDVEEVQVKRERVSFVRKPAVARRAVDKNSAVGDAEQSLVDLLPGSILSSVSVANAALELDDDRGELPKSLAAQDIAALLAACSEQAEISGQMHEEANAEHMDADSESSVDEESIDGPCPPAHPGNAAEDPAVGGFVEGSAFMERPQENQLKSAARQIQERSAFLALPRLDWIITLGKKSGKIFCVPKKNYEQQWRDRCVQKMPPREQFITEVGPLFGKELFSTLALPDLRQPLASLHKACNTTVWGLKSVSLSYDIYSIMKHPPSELFLSVSVDQLSQQYGRLRA